MRCGKALAGFQKLAGNNNPSPDSAADRLRDNYLGRLLDNFGEPSEAKAARATQTT